MKNKVCVFFPFSMGEAFLSGGVTKLVIANIDVVHQKYDTTLLMSHDNDAFEAYVRKNYPSVKVKQVEFYPIARFKDTNKIITRTGKTIKRLFLTAMTKKNVAKAIDEINPDIVHFHAEVSFPYIKSIKKQGRKTIFHASVYRFSKPEILRNLVSSTVIKYSDLILSPTKSIANLFEDKQKSLVLNNPIIKVSKDNASNEMDDSVEIEVLKEKLKFIFVGRICRVKQIHYFIKALEKLSAETRKNVEFNIIGQPNNESDQAYFEELKELIKKHELSDTVHFLGYKKNVEDYLKVMDVGVLLSESEAIPMAGIEYLINRLPIMAFDNPGLNEIVIDSLNGFLSKDGDVENIAKKIEYLQENPVKLQELSDNAYKFAQENYSLEAFEKRINEHYRDVLKR